jgi:hypothetical protein
LVAEWTVYGNFPGLSLKPPGIEVLDGHPHHLL